MKCESCGNELTGGAIICRVCNHNNALLGDWRSQRAGQKSATHRPTQSNQSRTTAPLAEPPKIVPRKDAEANLLRFPPSSNKQPGAQIEQMTVTGSETGTTAYPPWRAELKERVRQIREKRTTGELVAPPPSPVGPEEARLDRNPIVESALNRIRWSSHTPAITTTAGVSRHGVSVAAAAARLTQPEIETEIRRDRGTERARERESERARDRGTEGQRDRATEGQSLHPSVSPSLRPSISPPPRPPAPPSPNPSVTRPPADQVETKTLTPKPQRPKTHHEAGARTEPNPGPASRILTPRAKPQAPAESKTELRHEQRGHEAVRQPAAGQPLSNKPLAGKPLADAPDKHVETQVIEIAQAPEPMPMPEAEPASLWVRTMAGACDLEIILAAYLPIFGAYAVLNNNNSFGDKSFLIMMLLLSAIVFVYQMVTLTFAGRTSGMALLNLTLLNTDDESLHVTRRQKILRALTATIVFICPPLYLVTWLSLSRRTLPDLISGTTVAKD